MTELIRKPASSSNGGELTNETQTIQGDKTFTGNVIINGESIVEATESNLGLVKKARHLSAYLTSTTTHASAADFTIVYGTVENNTFGGSYNSGTGVFTAPTTGLYHICISAGVIDTASSNHILIANLRLTKNGTVFKVWDENYGTAPVVRTAAQINQTLLLNAGDTISATIVAVTSDGGNWQLVGGTNRYCTLTIHEVI